MFGLKLSHLFKSHPLKQLEKIAQRKPSILFGAAAIPIGAYFGLPYLGLTSGYWTTLLGACISATSIFSLGREYLRVFHLYQSPQNDIPTSTLTPKKVIIDGEVCAELMTIDGLPHCYIHGKDDYNNGRALAQLMPQEIIETIDRFYELLPYTLQLLHIGTPSFKWNIHQFIEDEVRRLQPSFPEYITRHLDGMVLELNRWIEQDNKRWIYQRPYINRSQLERFILLPDICKMLGCSAVIKRFGKNTEIWRNLDWPSLGIVQQQTMLLIHKLHHGRPSGPSATASVTITPGVAGLSLTNDKGLTVTINEATTMQTKRHNIGGIPEILHTREIVRKCTTLAEVEAFLRHSKPLTSHILTVMDANGDGAIFQILPPNSRARFTKRKFDENHDHLPVTNHHEDEKGDVIDGSISWPDSMQRLINIKDSLSQELRGFKTLRSCQQRPTTHSLIFTNQKDGETLEQQLTLRTHNAYSASKELPFYRINLTSHFKRLG